MNNDYLLNDKVIEFINNQLSIDIPKDYRLFNVFIWLFEEIYKDKNKAYKIIKTCSMEFLDLLILLRYFDYNMNKDYLKYYQEHLKQFEEIRHLIYLIMPIRLIEKKKELEDIYEQQKTFMTNNICGIFLTNFYIEYYDNDYKIPKPIELNFYKNNDIINKQYLLNDKAIELLNNQLKLNLSKKVKSFNLLKWVIENVKRFPELKKTLTIEFKLLLDFYSRYDYNMIDDYYKTYNEHYEEEIKGENMNDYNYKYFRNWIYLTLQLQSNYFCLPFDYDDYKNKKDFDFDEYFKTINHDSYIYESYIKA